MAIGAFYIGSGNGIKDLICLSGNPRMGDGSCDCREEVFHYFSSYHYAEEG